MNSSEILPLSLLNEHVLNINESFYKGLAVQLMERRKSIKELPSVSQPFICQSLRLKQT